MADENSSFRTLVKKYRRYFSLSQENVANLFDGKRSEYEGVETGRRTIDLDLANKIAGVYGLTYCQMIDSEKEIPTLETLPLKTQEVINARTQNGTIERDYDNDLAGHLDTILNTDFLNTARSAKEIWQKLPEEIRDKINPRRITDLLGKSPRNTIVVKAGKKGREQLFLLKILEK